MHAHSVSMCTVCMYRHEKYLGMWSDGVKSGPGMFVTSTGSYGEAIFSAGNIAVSQRCLLAVSALVCVVSWKPH